MQDLVKREFLVAFWKIHILHHAAARPVYGLWLLEELAEHGYRVSPGTLYPLLGRMERNGWLRSESGEGPKDCRFFRITRGGRRVLKALQDQVEELHREVVPKRPPRSRT